MAIAYVTGFETGTGSEMVSLPAGMTISTSHPRTGTYGLKCTTGAEGIYTNTLNLATVYIRHSVYFEHVGTPGGPGSESGNILILKSTADAYLLSVRVSHAPTDVRQLVIRNEAAGHDVGSPFTVVAAQTYVIQVKLTISTTVGVIELMVDGIVVATSSVENTGTTNIGIVKPSQMTNGGFTNYYIDDVMVDNAMYPSDRGVGFPIRPYQGTRPRPFAPGLAR